MAETKEKAGRTRNYATIVYEESAPENWRTILEELCVPCFISPYHNDDLLPTGEKKKPHYHVMLMFDSVKTMEQAKEVFEQIGGVGCETVKAIRGYARYLCHLDSPDKTKYNIEDVVCFGGSDYIGTISLTTDKYVAIKEIIAFCEDNDVFNYAQLLMWCSNNREDWFRVLCDNGTFVVKEYLKSRSWGVKTSQMGTEGSEDNEEDDDD